MKFQQMYQWFDAQLDQKILDGAYWYCLTVHTASQTIVNCKLNWYAIFAISKRYLSVMFNINEKFLQRFETKMIVKIFAIEIIFKSYQPFQSWPKVWQNTGKKTSDFIGFLLKKKLILYTPQKYPITHVTSILALMYEIEIENLFCLL